MTRVTEADVDQIASLAHLRLEPGERERLTQDMNRILEHADALRGRTAEPDSLTAAFSSLSGPGDDAAMHGVRSPEAESPDGLGRAPEEWAPRIVDGFFVVPPPPAVSSSEDAGS